MVVLAQEEARLLDHSYIGTEHLLLALLHEGEGVAAKVLEQLGVDRDRARAEVERRVGRGGTPSGHVPFTPRAKTVLELSLREALQLGHNYIGTEHILLGLVREGQGVAAQVLTELGVDLETVRTTTIQLLSGPLPASEQARPTGATGAACPSCRLPLEGRLGVQPLAVSLGESESIDQQVLVAYCRSCGCSIGLVAASPPSPPASS